MEDDAISRSIEVISVSEPADANGYLLSLEDHWLVGVVGHAYFEVSPREAKPRGPFVRERKKSRIEVDRKWIEMDAGN